MDNVLNISNRTEFRKWLCEHAATEKECWVEVRRGRPKGDDAFWYIDAVEEALCFGWIDSTARSSNGNRLQRFSPRKKGGLWTELNKERVRRLEKLGLMTEAGRKALPATDEGEFEVHPEVRAALQEAGVWEKFTSFPPLYRRVRAYNVAFYRGRDEQIYRKALARLIEKTKLGETYGEWNDYGRLTEDCDLTNEKTL